MNLLKFWQIIDAPHSIGGIEERMQELGKVVSKLSVEEYRGFLCCFDELRRTIVSRDDLVNAAYLANEQCLSSDVFDYFCYWLIGSGNAVFHQALKDPDSIVDLMRSHGGPQLEEFGTAISSGPDIDYKSTPIKFSIRECLWSKERQQELLPLLFRYSGG